MVDLKQLTEAKTKYAGISCRRVSVCPPITSRCSAETARCS